MVSLKILMLKKFKNHPKLRAMGKFIPSISHNYSTVDPSCEVIAKILQWLIVRSCGFCKNSQVRGHIAITLRSRTCAVIAEILQWPYGHLPLRYSLNLSGGLTGPRTLLQILIFFRQQRWP